MSRKELCIATLIPTKKLDKFGLHHLEASLGDIPCLELQPSKCDIPKTVRGLLRTFERVLILHKLGDYPESELGRDTRDALKSMSNVIWLDDPDRAASLSNRWTMYQLIRTYIANGECKRLKIAVPSTLLLEINQEVMFEEDSVLKPVDACGTLPSHQMIFLPSHTTFISNDTKYIRQPFIEHGGVMWKLYVIGKHVSIVPRRSLESRGETVVFSSHGLKEESVEPSALMTAHARVRDIRDDLEHLALHISACCCGLRLLGIDVIVDEMGVINVIDLNYFPGYDGVKDIPDKLAACIRDQANE
jgi:inositol-1,3,4-trisphosphate 5/6-kinase / inositol-tetrakisphosphate 1-kinase